jgi:hypothetical protein
LATLRNIVLILGIPLAWSSNGSAKGDARPDLVLPPPPVSTIRLQIRIPSTVLASTLEATVEHAHDESGAYSPGDVGFKYAWSRDPFSFAYVGDALIVQTNVAYRAGVRYCRDDRILGIRKHTCFGEVSCGFGEPPAVMRVVARVALQWSSEWHLVTNTSFEAPQTLVPCKVSAARIDVSGKIAEKVQSSLREKAGQLDGLIAADSRLRTMADHLWSRLSEPLYVKDDVWLSVTPVGAQLGQPLITPAGIDTTLVVTAYPSVTMGAKPSVTAMPLPNLNTNPVSGNGFHIVSNVDIAWATLGTKLTAAVKEPVTIKGQALTIGAVTVAPAGRDCVKVDLTVGGAVSGQVLLTGRLAYDAEKATVNFTDLGYQLVMDDPLGALFADASADIIKSKLGTAASWPVREPLEQLRSTLSRALVPRSDDRLGLTGSVDGVVVEGVYVTEQGITVRLRADGQLLMTPQQPPW